MTKQQLSCDRRHTGVSDGDAERGGAQVAAPKSDPREAAGAASVRSGRRSGILQYETPGGAGLTVSPIRSAILAGLVTGALLGCADSHPTGLGADPPSQTTPLDVTPELQAAFQAALVDANERLIPAFGAEADRAAVTAALGTLAEALADRDARALGRAVQTAERALGELGRGSDAGVSAMQADLDAVRLILAQARLLLTSSAE